jgi:hypothetical protein
LSVSAKCRFIGGRGARPKQDDVPPSASKRASRRDKRSGDAVPTVTSIANDTIAPASSETASESLGSKSKSPVRKSRRDD